MKKLACIIFILASVYKTDAQSTAVINDAALWANIYIEKKISDKFSVHLNQQDRLNDNFSRFGNSYLDMGITIRPLKKIKILADYVFTKKQRVDYTYSTRHQFYVALMLRKDIRKLSITYRNMLQNQYADPFTSENGRNPQLYERNKITFKYELNKYITPYYAQELYLPLNNTVLKGFDRLRTLVGAFYNVTKHQQLELYFMLQQQLQSKNALNHDYIYGIGYSIYI